jgi:hypothetical protein
MEGEGAGKGDTYRPVNREVFNRNFDDIFRKERWTAPVPWKQCPQCGRSTYRPICDVCEIPIP